MCILDDPEGNDDGQEYLTQPHLRPAAALLQPVGVASNTASEGRLIVEKFPLTFEGYTYKYGHIAYIEGRSPAPVILVHHNYAGLKQFDIDQACFLAKCGYVGVAVDLYKERELVGEPDQTLTYAFEDRDPKRDLSDFGSKIKGQVSEAQKARAIRHGNSWAAMMGLLRTPIFFRGLLAAWLDHARSHPAVHPKFAGAIGYCLGGQSLLEQVRAGHDLQAVCSFHGLLHSRPVAIPVRQDPRGPFFSRMTAEEYQADPTIQKAPNHYNTECKVLIENGDLDEEVPLESQDEFRKEMDAAGIDWRINNHARTPHAFALPPGLWGTKYTEDADRRSTLSMLQLFAETWPEFPQYPVPTNASGTVLGQSIKIISKL